MGLVLEWVYGTIVSTAEKARDGAKRALGELATHIEWACKVYLALQPVNLLVTEWKTIRPVLSYLVSELAAVGGAAVSVAASLCHLFHSLLMQSWPSVMPPLPLFVWSASQCRLCLPGQIGGIFG